LTLYENTKSHKVGLYTGVPKIAVHFMNFHCVTSKGGVQDTTSDYKITGSVFFE